MAIDFNQLLSHDLNQIYKEVKFHNDYPYQATDLAFLRTYQDLTTLAEIHQFKRLFDHLHQTMLADAWMYDGQVQTIFLDSYWQFHQIYLQLQALWKVYQTPQITSSSASYGQFQELVKTTLETQLGALNYHFQEFYLTLDSVFESERLLRLLTKDFPTLMKDNPTLATLIKLMHQFNQTQSVFLNQQFKSKIKVNQFKAFKLALKKVFYCFEPLIKVYNQLSFADDSLIPDAPGLLDLATKE